MDHVVHLVTAVQMALQEERGLMAQMDMMDKLAQLVHLVHLDPLVRLEDQGLRVMKVTLAHQAHRVRMEGKDLTGPPADLAWTDHVAPGVPLEE